MHASSLSHICQFTLPPCGFLRENPKKVRISRNPGIIQESVNIPVPRGIMDSPALTGLDMQESWDAGAGIMGCRNRDIGCRSRGIIVGAALELGIPLGMSQCRISQRMSNVGYPRECPRIIVGEALESGISLGSDNIGYP